MAFQISRAVLPLTVRLIDWLRVDEGTGRTSALVVRIDIVDMHEESGIRHVSGQRRIEAMFRRYAVQPNRGITGTHLCMNWMAFRVSRHASAVEAEGTNEEIVSRRHVLVGQDRDESLEIGHHLVLSCTSR
jgi:hypothetical protein